MQRHARRLFVLFFLLTAGAAAALLLPVGLIWLLGTVGVFSYEGVLAMLLSWQFLLATTVVAVIVIRLKARR